MRGYDRPISQGKITNVEAKPVSIGAAFANGFAKGLKAGGVPISNEPCLDSLTPVN